MLLVGCCRVPHSEAILAGRRHAGEMTVKAVTIRARASRATLSADLGWRSMRRANRSERLTSHVGTIPSVTTRAMGAVTGQSVGLRSQYEAAGVRGSQTGTNSGSY